MIRVTPRRIICMFNMSLVLDSPWKLMGIKWRRVNIHILHIELLRINTLYRAEWKLVVFQAYQIDNRLYLQCLLWNILRPWDLIVSCHRVQHVKNTIMTQSAEQSLGSLMSNALNSTLIWALLKAYGSMRQSDMTRREMREITMLGGRIEIHGCLCIRTQNRIKSERDDVNWYKYSLRESIKYEQKWAKYFYKRMGMKKVWIIFNWEALRHSQTRSVKVNSQIRVKNGAEKILEKLTIPSNISDNRTKSASRALGETRDVLLTYSRDLCR